jgi:RNA polymerase sigma factor for flagellar operon FliA
VNYDKDTLILEHLNLAKQIALREWRTATHALDKDDMLGLAYLGLTDAANRWESYCVRKGYEPSAVHYFKVFASLRIRGTIRDSIRSDDWATRTLRSKSKRLKEAGQDEGVPVEVLAERTEMTVTEINKVNARLAAKPVSLDAHLNKSGTGFDSTNTNENQVKDSVDTEGSVFAREMTDIFIDTVRNLTMAEQLVLVLHYYSKLDFRKISEELEVPEAKVSQLHGSAVSSVKEALTYAAIERD